MNKSPLARVRLAALIPALLCLCWLAPAAQAQTAFAPAAVVNDDVITFYDVEQRIALLQISGAAQNQGAARAALESLIDDQLRNQAAELFQITASEDMLNDGLDEFAQRFRVDRAGLIGRAQSVGATEASLMDLVRSQVLWRDLVLRRFGARATPTEIELDQEIALAAAGRTRAFLLSEIALATGEGREANARATMETILRELDAGANFTDLARRYSASPSAAQGGDVGWVPETALPPDLAQLVASTPPGGVTAPLAVPGGLSIYRVADTREEAPPWARDAEVSYRRISIAGDEEDAMSEAKELGQTIEGCEAIPDLSDQAVMESIDTKLVNALPGPIQGAVRLLQAGQASAPIRTDDGVAIFVVCDRTGGVDAETRGRLREQIRTQRLARFAEGYLQDLRREAVIERR